MSDPTTEALERWAEMARRDRAALARIRAALKLHGLADVGSPPEEIADLAIAFINRTR